jgi:hypothetical protein
MAHVRNLFEYDAIFHWTVARAYKAYTLLRRGKDVSTAFYGRIMAEAPINVTDAMHIHTFPCEVMRDGIVTSGVLQITPDVVSIDNIQIALSDMFIDVAGQDAGILLGRLSTNECLIELAAIELKDCFVSALLQNQ